MPGVQVGEAGGITVNGKPIDKVLIEGDDMFGANYTIGTRNIRANVIDKVQVIDHYQDNPVLKDVKESDRMVLNLSIKEEKKNIISGTYTVGAGYGKELKTYLHTNLFSLSKKAKTFLLGNYNNNGFDAKGELSATFTDLNIDNQAIDNSISEPLSLINLPTIQYIGLPEKFTARRRLGLGNLSQIFNITSFFKVKLLGTHYREKNNQQYFNQNTFFSQKDTISYKEESVYSNKNLLTDVVIQTDYLSSQQNSSLKTHSNIAIQANKVNLSLNRRENNLIEYVLQFTKEQPTHIFNALEYTQKLSRHAASQVIISHFYSRNKQQLNSRYIKYPVFFGMENLDSLFQNSNISQSVSQIIFRYIYNKNVSLNFDIGYSWNTTNVSSNSMLYRAKFEYENKNLSSNRIEIEKSSPLLRAVLKKRIRVIDLSLGLNASLETITSPQVTSSNYLLLAPFLQLKIPLNTDANFKLIYQYKNELPDVNTLTNHFIFVDYQTISTGVLDFTPLREHRIVSRFGYKDILNSFYFNASGYLSSSHNALGTSFNFNKDIFRQFFYRPVYFKAFGGGFSVEKLFFDISSRFLLRYNYNSYSTQNKINGLDQDIRYTTNEIFFDYGSAFDLPLNFYLTNSLRLTNSLSSIINEWNQLLTYNTKFKLLYKPSKNFYLDASWYSIYNKIISGFNNYLNSIEMNASFIFERKRRRHEISLSIVNIPNKEQFIINNIDTYSQSRYSLEVTPRFFLIKWDTSF